MGGAALAGRRRLVPDGPTSYPQSDQRAIFLEFPHRGPSHMTSRRKFIQTSATLGGAFGLSPLVNVPIVGAASRRVEKARASLNILILGGTGFTGPEQVEYAIARGHRVTLFNRNKTRPGMFKGKVAEELIGDLNNDTSALKGKQFDVSRETSSTTSSFRRRPPTRIRASSA
jgi:hypothetical protein